MARNGQFGPAVGVYLRESRALLRLLRLLRLNHLAFEVLNGVARKLHI